MKKTGSSGDLNGFLDAGSFITGTLQFEDTFRLDGHLKGTVVSSGDLVVGSRGEIEADIEVGRIFVSGTVRGKVVAKRRVEVAAGGKFLADLETPSLVVEDGAILQGQCNMGEREQAATEKPRAENVTPLKVPSKA